MPLFTTRDCKVYKNDQLVQVTVKQCEDFCQSFPIIQSNSRNEADCLSSCIKHVYSHNINEQTLEYINCLNAQTGNEQIIIDTQSQVKAQFEYNKSLKDPSKVILLDYAYYKPLSAEPIVRNYLKNKGFTNIHQSTNKTDEYFLHWTFTASKINWDLFISGNQLVNHIKNNVALTSKIGLLQTLREYDQKESSLYNSTIFFPETYIIDLSLDGMNDEERQILQLQPPQWWIIKPDRGFGGDGIKVIKNITHFNNHFIKRKSQGIRDARPLYVLQQYMMNPLLIENKKFDLRYFVIVPCADPFLALLYQGFIRKGFYNFTLDSDSKEDDYRHITNIKLQRQHPDFEKIKEDQVWLFDKFEHYLLQQYSNSQVNEMWIKIKKSLSYTLKAGKTKFEAKLGMFQFFTFDYMIDENLEPMLIEVNGSPSWSLQNNSYKDLKVDLFTQIMDLIIFLQQDISKVKYYIENFEKLSFLGLDKNKFEILINDAINYNYHAENQ